MFLGPDSGPQGPAPRRRKADARLPLVGVAVLLFVASDTPANGADRHTETRGASETQLAAAERAPRRASWAEELVPLEVESVWAPTTGTPIRFYATDGDIDEGARSDLERVAASHDSETHRLAARVEQLVVKAAYHFDNARVVLVSGWRAHAGRHTAGDAIDFKLKGVHAAQLASYLRGLARVGVGIYTHPRTQFVHIDVRDESFHWMDASPPGVKYRERALRDPHREERDASWTQEDDLP